MAYGPFNVGSGSGSGSETIKNATGPTKETVGKLGQHFLNTTTGKEYVCVSTEGGYTWSMTNASDAVDITYNGRTVKDALEDLEAIVVKTFGVQWDYNNPSTELTRLTRATDPNHFVTVDITEEPVPAVGTGAGSSPFDNYLPWAGMEEYNIENGVVTCARGDSNFSRTTKDTMVYIPEYYFHVVDDAENSKRYFYISNQPCAGFSRHPGSGKYVARYNTGESHVSRSGLMPLGGLTRDEFRQAAIAKGGKWSLCDYVTWCAVWLLYIVEYANWDSQTAIGPGNVASGEKKSTGGTDAMTYHTGKAYNDEDTDGDGWGCAQVQYRHIEDPWGNCYEFLDGANFFDRELYICLDHTKFADDTAEGYTATSLVMPSNNGFISKIGYSAENEYLFVPIETAGDDMSYIPDRAYSNAGWRVLRVSGNYNNDTNYGLFYFNATTTSSTSNVNNGARHLCPQKKHCAGSSSPLGENLYR